MACTRSIQMPRNTATNAKQASSSSMGRGLYSRLLRNTVRHVCRRTTQTSFCLGPCSSRRQAAPSESTTEGLSNTVCVLGKRLIKSLDAWPRARRSSSGSSTFQLKWRRTSQGKLKAVAKLRRRLRWINPGAERLYRRAISKANPIE